MLVNRAQQRHRDRLTVHSQFAVPATYQVLSTGAQSPVMARLHRKTATLGEGAEFASILVEEDRIVLRLDELPADIERLDEVYFHDEDVTAVIDVQEPATPPVVACKVKLRPGR